ncbi:MAG: NACHT C-terminal helical domain 2-containing protein, partial [Microcystaceae cyanobacterium]
MPNPEGKEAFKKRWQAYGESGQENLRQVMITRRNISHDWQFTDQQKELLQQY